tara:strand:+ start:4718 stop:5926 length:1209 start_codon:yes stop_codon:yes gene_type:complete
MREPEFNKFKNILENIENNKNNISVGKGIYLYGESGVGKTSFVINSLHKLNYDIVQFDINDTNKSLSETINSYNMSDRNVMSMMTKKIKKIVIMIDDIDSIKYTDKTFVSLLLKLVRPKKTKKQLKEEKSVNPIVFIGNKSMDKKCKELLKVCENILLEPLTRDSIESIISNKIGNCDETMYNYVGHDLRKLQFLSLFESDKISDKLFVVKSCSENDKQVTMDLLKNCYSIEDHLKLLNYADRTIIGLLWHENIITILNDINIYSSIINNICYADYIDRITFQKQIWQFNEMSSLIKVFYSNKIFHDNFKGSKSIDDIIFTKILTKYSTEYNNFLFIQSMCNKLNVDRKDMLTFVLNNQQCEDVFQKYDISKIDTQRVLRYINNTNKKYTEDIDEEYDGNII